MRPVKATLHSAIIMEKVMEKNIIMIKKLRKYIGGAYTEKAGNC